MSAGEDSPAHRLGRARADDARRRRPPAGGARTAVVEALAGHDCAVTALDLDDELRAPPPPVGRASVYRALEQLEQLGLVQRIEVCRGTAGYERVDPTGHHHHHAICRDCGRMVPFEDPRARAGPRAKSPGRWPSTSPSTTSSCADCVSAAPAEGFLYHPAAAWAKPALFFA